jgi:hypothetical protein
MEAPDERGPPARLPRSPSRERAMRPRGGFAFSNNRSFLLGLPINTPVDLIRIQNGKTRRFSGSRAGASSPASGSIGAGRGEPSLVRAQEIWPFRSAPGHQPAYAPARFVLIVAAPARGSFRLRGSRQPLELALGRQAGRERARLGHLRRRHPPHRRGEGEDFPSDRPVAASRAPQKADRRND